MSLLASCTPSTSNSSFESYENLDLPNAASFESTYPLVRLPFNPTNEQLQEILHDVYVFVSVEKVAWMEHRKFLAFQKEKKFNDVQKIVMKIIRDRVRRSHHAKLRKEYKKSVSKSSKDFKNSRCFKSDLTAKDLKVILEKSEKIEGKILSDRLLKDSSMSNPEFPTLTLIEIPLMPQNFAINIDPEDLDTFEEIRIYA